MPFNICLHFRKIIFASLSWKFGELFKLLRNFSNKVPQRKTQKLKKKKHTDISHTFFSENLRNILRLDTYIMFHIPSLCCLGHHPAPRQRSDELRPGAGPTLPVRSWQQNRLQWAWPSGMYPKIRSYITDHLIRQRKIKKNGLLAKKKTLCLSLLLKKKKWHWQSLKKP